MTAPAGGVYLYKYDESSSIVLSGQPLGGNLTSVTYPDGHKRIYWYNEQAKTANTNLPYALTGITDENGIRYASYWYNSQGKAIKEQHAPDNPGLAVNSIYPDQHDLSYTTDASGNPTKTVVTDPLGTVRTYNFTTILGVVKSTGTDQPGGSGCAAASSGITYDANGNVASRTDFNSHKTCYAYDTTRNLETARIEGLASSAVCADMLNGTTPLTTDARKISTEWHATFRLPTKITEPGRETSYVYDATSGNVLTKTITDIATGKTRVWTYSYTTAADNTLVNLLKTIDGPRTDVTDTTTYTYYTADDVTVPTPKYRKGDLWKVTNALGHVTQITQYDGNGRPLTILDPNNVTTTLEYWPRGWLKSKTVGAKTTNYDYDNVGQLKKVTLADGSYIQYGYDDAHRLTDIWDAANNHIKYTLDAMGNRTQEEVFDSNSNLSTKKGRDFDALNRLWHDIAYYNDPAVAYKTEYGYDANGNLTSAKDPLLHTTNYNYDMLDRLQVLMASINGTPISTQYGYDSLDQLRTVKDPRSVTTGYTVDGLGNTQQTASLDSGTTSRTFDEAGNVKTETDARNIQANYTYDALNRLTSVSYPSTGENITYTWDTATSCTYGIGRLCQITHAGGTTSFAYDDQGNLTKQTRVISGISLTTQYGYDGANRLTSQNTQSGESISLTRTKLYGQIDSVSTTNGATTNTLEKQITYDGTGELTARTFGNGVQKNAGTDLSGLPSTWRFNQVDGDLNGDGIVNIVDVLFAARISGGLMTPTADQLVHGDVAPAGNPDGKIDVIDLLRILRKYEGKESF